MPLAEGARSRFRDRGAVSFHPCREDQCPICGNTAQRLVVCSCGYEPAADESRIGSLWALRAGRARVPGRFAVTLTHVTWLRLTAAIDRRKLMRPAIAAAVWSACLLGHWRCGRSCWEIHFPDFSGVVGAPMAFSAIVSAMLWIRGVRYFRNGVPRAVKVWRALSGAAALVALGFYAGRVTAPGPELFGHHAVFRAYRQALRF